ncbi:M36 family metallopeptidase [Citrobacter gillenii]|uniref:M36 family metallopeptidase n=1 Tax=Citrobacter gillenii TaxID=67828 RepID=UPI00398819E4
MSQPIVDKRNLDYDCLGANGGIDRFTHIMKSVSADLGNSVQAGSVNTFTGHLNELRAEREVTPFEMNNITDGDYIAEAKNFLLSVSRALGFEPGFPAEFEADPMVTMTSEGMRVVSLQQTLNGIEVWGMEPKVWFKSDGAIDRVSGNTVSLTPSLPRIASVAPEVALGVAAAEAAKPRTKVDILGQEFSLPALDVSQWNPIRTGQDTRASKTTAFDNGPFEDIAAATLCYFYMGDHARLAWRFIIAREFHAAQFLIFVEADVKTNDLSAPEILYVRDMNSSAIAGKVFKHNPNEGPFIMVDFPLATSDYPVSITSVDLPAGFPLPWTEASNGHISTKGNNVCAFNGATRLPLEIVANENGGEFNEAIDTPNQYITNIFYLCNYMHDFFLMLGFTEESGNFQATNVTGKGKGADPVHAFAHPGAVYGTANMATRADGTFAVMNMGLFVKTERHTANDADVVFHEFVHGVTNRLVGGLRDAQGLSEDQSVAMGEGWSDFFALTIINYSRKDERVVTGDYVTNISQGIRQRPYDKNYPGTFGDIGKGVGQVIGSGNSDLSYQEVHAVGEIWCAALMELTRAVVTALGDKQRGYQITWQAVVDGLKLTPKNPSFLIARDAILRSFTAMDGSRLTSAEYSKVLHGAWQAFARFGMGFDANCPNASFIGCRGGMQLPPKGWES